MRSHSARYVLPFAAVMIVAGTLSTAFAQEEGADGEDVALAEAHRSFAAVLKKTDNVFFKEVDRDGNRFYNVVWEHDGEMLRINIHLTNLGTYNGARIFGMSAWTLVSESEQSIPPAVIKAVATTNDRLTIGNVSCSNDFRQVYANVTSSIKELTPGSLWLYFAYMNANTKHMRGIIDEAGLGS